MIRDHYPYRKVIHDPRTNEDMDYDDAMMRHYYDFISIPDLQNVISRRIPYFNVDNMQEFIPSNNRHLVTVTAFAQDIMTLYQARKR